MGDESKPVQTVNNSETVETLDDLGGPVQTVKTQPERHIIAYLIVGIFIVSILLCFRYTFVNELKEGIELFTTVSAVLSGPLGVVLGFYFGSRGREKQ